MASGLGFTSRRPRIRNNDYSSTALQKEYQEDSAERIEDETVIDIISDRLARTVATDKIYAAFQQMVKNLPRTRNVVGYGIRGVSDISTIHYNSHGKFKIIHKTFNIALSAEVTQSGKRVILILAKWSHKVSLGIGPRLTPSLRGPDHSHLSTVLEKRASRDPSDSYFLH
ncbi:hypothetical protein TNCV_1121111 [Trichonephila clavipes]|uniref:Uncharacterized protein n=1 Tax=Trichonephila clavipes TaxID=2585209 RepID=A0A8X6T3X9_TRICX|nr:hypothetical protein TNCV_1121111 [Trichonephila clavipes]